MISQRPQIPNLLRIASAGTSIGERCASDESYACKITGCMLDERYIASAGRR